MDNKEIELQVAIVANCDEAKRESLSSERSLISCRFLLLLVSCFLFSLQTSRHIFCCLSFKFQSVLDCSQKSATSLGSKGHRTALV